MLHSLRARRRVQFGGRMPWTGERGRHHSCSEMPFSSAIGRSTPPSQRWSFFFLAKFAKKRGRWGSLMVQEGPRG